MESKMCFRKWLQKLRKVFRNDRIRFVQKEGKSLKVDCSMTGPSGNAIDIVSEIHCKNNAKDAEQDKEYER